MKRYKVVQDRTGTWGIVDQWAGEDQLEWGDDSFAPFMHQPVAVTSAIRLNKGAFTKPTFGWVEYEPRVEP